MNFSQSELPAMVLAVVADAEGGACWRVCLGGACAVDRDRRAAERRLLQVVGRG